MDTMIDGFKPREKRFLHDLLATVALNSKTDATSKFFERHRDRIVRDIGGPQPVSSHSQQPKTLKRVKKDLLVAPPPPTQQTQVISNQHQNGDRHYKPGQPIVPITNQREIRPYQQDPQNSYDPNYRQNQGYR